MSTTEGAERAEVLDELSHIAYKKDNYAECLHLVDTSIGIYYKLGGSDVYLKELINCLKIGEILTKSLSLSIKTATLRRIKLQQG